MRRCKDKDNFSFNSFGNRSINTKIQVKSSSIFGDKTFFCTSIKGLYPLFDLFPVFFVERQAI